MPSHDKARRFDNAGEMANALEEKKSAYVYGKNWKNSPDKAARISSIIASNVELFSDALLQGPARLDDIEDIAERAKMYLNACVEKSVLPTWLGLCNYAFGRTRRGVEWYVKEHSETETARFLLLLRDALGSMMLDSGLSRNTSEILTIFALRNMNGFSGGDVAEALPESPPETKTAEEILSKYGDLLV